MFQVPRRKGKRQLFFSGIILIIFAILVGTVFAVRTIQSHVENLPPKHERIKERREQEKQEMVEKNIIPEYGKFVEGQPYIQFTGEEFKNFYNNFRYEHVGDVEELPEITGNATADARIRTIAESRGYKARPAADEKYLQDVLGQKLQSSAKQDFLKLKEIADAAVGTEFILASGYRSPERQQQIFNNSIQNTSTSEIISGDADEKINEILITRSIPGYSKHHTGYTIDIGCGNYLLDYSFADTECFKWLSANNYENAKRFGFIPSYPEDSGKQGPEPEPWEYVWVGEDALLANFE